MHASLMEIRTAHCHHPRHLSVVLKQPPAAQVHLIFLLASDGESTRKRPHQPRRRQLLEEIAGNPRKRKAKE